jgi:hypothetical protein
VRVRDVEYPDGVLQIARSARLRVLVRNKGVGASAGAGLTGTLTSLSAGINVLQGTVSYADLLPRTDGAPISDSLFRVAADDSVTPGRRALLRVDFTTPAGYFSRDTIEVVVGVPTQVYANDGGSGLGDWSPGSWGIVNDDPTHPSQHFNDSPSGNYPSGADNALTLTPPLDLSDGVHAYAEFVTRWSFEQDYDGATVEASLDAINWSPLAGRYTKPGSSITGTAQPTGLPVYDCNNYQWRSERVDLSPFSGAVATAVRLRFRTVSDGGKNFDGFRFDDLRVVVYDPTQQPSLVAVGPGRSPAGLALLAPWPNPARGGARFGLLVPPGAGQLTLELLDLQGRRVRSLRLGALPAGRHEAGWDGRDDEATEVANGVYFAILRGARAVAVRRVALVR